MSEHDDVAARLPFYANGTLSAGERATVEAHLAACEECRDDLAFWQALGVQVEAQDRSLPAPAPAVLQRTLRSIRAGRRSSMAQAWQLLRAQLQLVRPEIWLSSAAILAIGYLVTRLSGHGDGASIIGLLAPIVAAGSVALVYGQDNDLLLEMALATPTSPRQVLLARLVLVFGFDLVLTLAATLGLLGSVPAHLLGSIIVSWLGPMTMLSALALVLSISVGATNALAAAFLVWAGQWMASGILHGPQSVNVGSVVLWMARAYESAWRMPALQFALAALLLGSAVWLAGRSERLLAPR